MAGNVACAMLREQVVEYLNVIRSHDSSYFLHESQPNPQLRDEGQVVAKGESDGNDSKRKSGREPEVAHACGTKNFTGNKVITSERLI